MNFFQKTDKKIKDLLCRVDKFSKELHYKAWRVTENKTLEIQANRWENWQWFDIEIKWTRKQDHAGFQFNFQVLGFYFHVWLCDNRHEEDI